MGVPWHRRKDKRDQHKPNTPAGYYSSAVAQGLTQHRVDVPPETLAAFKKAAARAGMSQRQATDYAYRKFAREMGIDIAPAPEPEPQDPKPLTRPIVPPLDC
jgi:hypothetical protein